MKTGGLSMWLALLLFVAAKPAECQHRKFLQKFPIAPSKPPTTPLGDLSSLRAEQAPLLSSNRRMLQDDPIADAQAIGGVLGKLVHQAGTALVKAITGAQTPAAGPAAALTPAFPPMSAPLARPAPSSMPAEAAAQAPLPAATTTAAPTFAPAFAPASAPASGPAAESSSGARMWAELADRTAAAAGSTQALYAVQVPQLADMHSSASNIDHSRNLALHPHLQSQHVLEASKLSLQHAMDKAWAIVNASFDIVKEMPEEVASFPHDVAENLATAGRNFEEEAFNATYALDSFDKFRHQLEDPVAVEGGASVFSFSPCFFHANVGALEAFATGINIGASLLSVSPSGLTIQPQALSITPTLLSVGATGVNVQPDGLNISPSLIAVTPGRVSVNAKGGGISPVGLSVTAP